MSVSSRVLARASRITGWFSSYALVSALRARRRPEGTLNSIVSFPGVGERVARIDIVRAPDKLPQDPHED